MLISAFSVISSKIVTLDPPPIGMPAVAEWHGPQATMLTSALGIFSVVIRAMLMWQAVHPRS